MPPRKGQKRDKGLVKKHPLTLTQLATFDNIATDFLVDHVYFWTRIRKCGSRYTPARHVESEDMPSIIRKHVILGRNPVKALAQLSNNKAVKKAHQRLRRNERQYFEQHLRRYLNIYMPDCPWEVGTTNRYTIVTDEAAVFARKTLHRHEVIKYLTGQQVTMNEEEAKDLDLANHSFSIVVSCRKMTESLFLGPARFANHDCEPNARLQGSGRGGMQIIAMTDINPGDEITVSYGENYFGEDNQECLCATCESKVRNGWDPIAQENRISNDATTIGGDANNWNEHMLKGRKHGRESAGSESGDDRSREAKRLKGPMLGFMAPHSPPLRDHRIKARSLFDPFDDCEPGRRTIQSPAAKSRAEAFSRWVNESEEDDSEDSSSNSTTNLAPSTPASSFAADVDRLRETPSPTRLTQLRTDLKASPPTLIVDSAESVVLVNIGAQLNAWEPSPFNTTDCDGVAPKEMDDDIKCDPTDSISTTKITPKASSNPPIPDHTKTFPTPIEERPLVTNLTKPETPLIKTEPLLNLVNKPIAEFHRVHRTYTRSTTKARYRTTKAARHRRLATTTTTTKEDEILTPFTALRPGMRYPDDYNLIRLHDSPTSTWHRCTTCRAWDLSSTIPTQTHRDCPRCERHLKLFALEWPQTELGRHDSTASGSDSDSESEEEEVPPPPPRRKVSRRYVSEEPETEPSLLLTRPEVREMRKAGSLRTAREELERRRRVVRIAARRRVWETVVDEHSERRSGRERGAGGAGERMSKARVSSGRVAKRGDGRTSRVLGARSASSMF